MNLKTSNYGFARSVQGLFEFIAWLMLGLGVIATFIMVGTASRGFGTPGLIVALPGIAFCLASMWLLVHIQMGKAAVDSADYAYQSLAIAREQFEISKRSLASQRAPQTYAERSAPEDKAAASAGAGYGNPTNGQATGTAVAQADPTPIETEWSHRGEQIKLSAQGYSAAGDTFRSLNAAKDHIDFTLDQAIEKRGGQYWVAGKNFLKLENAQAFSDQQRETLARPMANGDRQDYRGMSINRTEHGYLVEGETFDSIEAAKNFIDGEQLRADLDPEAKPLFIQRDGSLFRVNGQYFQDRESAQLYVDEQAAKA